VTTTVDANGHRTDVWTDPLGRTNIVRTYTGNSPATYTLYAQTQQWYTYQGPLANIVHPDGTTLTSFSYDLAGRKTGMSDPDSGTWSYSYDADGNLIQQSDGRGAAGTLYAGYDGLNRQLWRNSTNSATGAYATYSYDSTLNGNLGIGRLTGESFNGGATGTALGAGSYAYTYDARGQRSGQTITLGGTAYAFAYAYNDAGQPTSTTYSDGEALALSYGTTGLLAGATTTPSGGTATTLANALTYTGTGGAFGQPTGATIGGGVYSFAASFDALDRLTARSLSRVSPAATLFSSARGYDAVGNVASVTTTLPAGTDTQAFCYDEQNRLTWASAATEAPPCGGTLSSARCVSPE
jgi:YD repeat-containing protein